MFQRALLLVMVLTAATFGDDWPQFRGPGRDGVSSEKGLLKQWPEGGPPVIWKVDHVGEGYSSLAVVADRIYTQGDIDGVEHVVCLSRNDGAIVWKTAPQPGVRFTHEKQGSGPRGTPTVEKDFVYSVGGRGNVTCVDAKTGRVIWHVALTDLGGRIPGWGYSESPLVVGDKLIVTPGGEQGTVAALDKKTGKVLWRSTELKERASYSSPQIARIAGIDQIVQFAGESAFGLTVDSGKPLWRYTRASNRTANITMPVIFEDYVFVSSAYNTGAGMIQVFMRDQKIQVDEIYFNKRMQNHHGGIVRVESGLYGFGQGGLVALEIQSGKELWVDPSVRKGSIIAADGMLYCLGERHEMALVEASPKGYVERGRFKLANLGRPSWAHPAIADGRLYLRNMNEVTVYDLRPR